MDKILQALDRVREERTKLEDRFTSRVASPTNTFDATGSYKPPSKGSGSFVYTKTRVFTPSAELLESSRVLDPRSSEAAPAAFRLLRTQVLQRMDTNGWRSLAIFSAT